MADKDILIRLKCENCSNCTHFRGKIGNSQPSCDNERRIYNGKGANSIDVFDELAILGESSLTELEFLQKITINKLKCDDYQPVMLPKLATEIRNSATGTLIIKAMPQYDLQIKESELHLYDQSLIMGTVTKSK